MPAIVNPHGHIGYFKGAAAARENFSRENVLDHLRRLAYYGVSVFQSLGTDRDDIELGIRDEQRAGTLEIIRIRRCRFSARIGLVAPTPGSDNGGPYFATDVIREVRPRRRHGRRCANSLRRTRTSSSSGWMTATARSGSCPRRVLRDHRRSPSARQEGHRAHLRARRRQGRRPGLEPTGRLTWCGRRDRTRNCWGYLRQRRLRVHVDGHRQGLGRGPCLARRPVPGRRPSTSPRGTRSGTSSARCGTRAHGDAAGLASSRPGCAPTSRPWRSVLLLGRHRPARAVPRIRGAPRAGGDGARPGCAAPNAITAATPRPPAQMLGLPDRGSPAGAGQARPTPSPGRGPARKHRELAGRSRRRHRRRPSTARSCRSASVSSG